MNYLKRLLIQTPSGWSVPSVQKYLKIHFINMEKKRPKFHFEIDKKIKEMIRDNENLMKLPYKEKKKETQQIYYYLQKMVETTLLQHDLEINFNKVLGEIILNDDLGNPLVNNAYDAIITENGRNKVVNVRFCGEKTLKVQFKNLLPMALTKEVSLSRYLVEKYTKENCCVIFMIKNNSDPHYYNKDVKRLLYLPKGLTSEGFQYYLLPSKNLKEGRIGQHGNYYYEVKPYGLMWNIGLRFKNGQLNIQDFDDEQN